MSDSEGRIDVASSEAAELSSWRQVDLEAACDSAGGAEPEILRRSDGLPFLYRGSVHGVHGEPECGKGWLTLSAAADVLDDDRYVVYADWEADPVEIVERLEALGVSREQILRRFVYVQPDEPLTDDNRREFEAILDLEPALVILDGVTEALALQGLTYSNIDIALWLQMLAKPAARRGAAVVVIDHVPKDSNGRGRRFAIGGQHKLAACKTTYGLEMVEPFARGKTGKAKVWISKDRPGFVRAKARKNGLIAEMRLVSDPETGAATVTLDPPDKRATPAADADGKPWRPTEKMAEISRLLEAEPGLSNGKSATAYSAPPSVPTKRSSSCSRTSSSE